MKKPDKKHPASVPYEDSFHKRLRNPKYARAYLAECMADDEASFLRAVQHVSKAQGITVEEMAERADIHRVSLQRIYAGKVEPKFNTIMRVLKELNINLSFTPRKKTAA